MINFIILRNKTISDTKNLWQSMSKNIERFNIKGFLIEEIKHKFSQISFIIV